MPGAGGSWIGAPPSAASGSWRTSCRRDSSWTRPWTPIGPTLTTRRKARPSGQYVRSGSVFRTTHPRPVASFDARRFLMLLPVCISMAASGSEKPIFSRLFGMRPRDASTSALLSSTPLSSGRWATPRRSSSSPGRRFSVSTSSNSTIPATPASCRDSCLTWCRPGRESRQHPTLRPTRWGRGDSPPPTSCVRSTRWRLASLPCASMGSITAAAPSRGTPR